MKYDKNKIELMKIAKYKDKKNIIIIMAIFCTFMPLLLIAEGIKRIGASRFSLLNTSGPVMTIFFCFIILGETMTYQQIIGSILIIGVLYIAEKNKKKS